MQRDRESAPSLAKTLGAIFVAALVGLSGAGPAASEDPAREGRRVLLRSAEAYRAVPALVDAFTYRVTMPGSEEKEESIRFRLGEGSDVLLDLGAVEYRQLGDRFLATQASAPHQYLEVPIEGDFSTTLDRVMGGNANMPVPAQVEMRAGKGVDVYARALSFGILVAPRVTGYRRVSRPAGELHEIEFTAENGRLVVRVDAETWFLAEAEIEAVPQGAPPEAKLVGAGYFSPEVPATAEGVVTFEPGSREAVATMAELVNAPVVVGSEAPDFELATADGERVRLADQRGRVVVMDFWASWCGLCRLGLPKLDEFAAWAREEGLPVSVWAINTLETWAADERAERAEAYWDESGLGLVNALDLDDEVARAYGVSNLPNSFVVAPDGRVAKIQFRYAPGIEEILKRDVRALLSE